MKMLVTLLPPASGTAKIAGYDLLSQPALVRRSIGYVPQLLSADGMLTGYENLLIFAQLYDLPRKERAARIDQALTSAALHDAANHLVNTYHGTAFRRRRFEDHHALSIGIALLPRIFDLFTQAERSLDRYAGTSSRRREPRLSICHFSAMPGSDFRTASTRPCLIASTRAAWSCSVWSPYASAKSARAPSRALELPQ